MSLTIAILGASGAVGSSLSTNILRSDLLEPFDRIQLVGHGEANSTGRLSAICMDLLDAFDDHRVIVDVLPDISESNADLVVMAAGVALPPGSVDRREMGRANLPVFQHAAGLCAQYLPDASYIIVSNPVELAVKSFSDVINRKQILGMGAEQDSLRFARSIARGLGVSRHEISAGVWGEHGRNMVPIWSSARVRSRDSGKINALDELRAKAASLPLAERVSQLQSQVQASLASGDLQKAYQFAEQSLPDARIFIEPFITATAIHSTPNATANAVLNCLRAWKADDDRLLHAQVSLNGELKDRVGVFGVPVRFGPAGWELDESCEHLNAIEEQQVEDSFHAVQAYLDELTKNPEQAPTMSVV
ncbi:MAG TPA: lactate dehydrogenase [Acidobacteriaceae bacterium]